MSKEFLNTRCFSIPGTDDQKSLVKNTQKKNGTGILATPTCPLCSYASGSHNNICKMQSKHLKCINANVNDTSIPIFTHREDLSRDLSCVRPWEGVQAESDPIGKLLSFLFVHACLDSSCTESNPNQSLQIWHIWHIFPHNR